MDILKGIDPGIEDDSFYTFPDISPEKLTMLGSPPWKIMVGTLRVCGNEVFVVEESDNVN